MTHIIDRMKHRESLLSMFSATIARCWIIGWRCVQHNAAEARVSPAPVEIPQPGTVQRYKLATTGAATSRAGRRCGFVTLTQRAGRGSAISLQHEAANTGIHNRRRG